jgi:HlyD family secretion protein
MSIAVCFALLLGCEPIPESRTEYRTATVDVRDIVVVVESAGVIQPHRTIEVKSKASGEILSIHAETGDFVEEGTLIVQIDKRTPRNQLELVTAQREASLARRAIAEAQHERAQRLFKSRSINEVDYEKTVLELADSKSEIVRSQVSIENAQFALDDTEVNAPITGTVIEKLVEKGQVISSPISDVGGGTVLMKMADLRTMQVQALVNEIDIGKVRPGQAVTVRVTSYPNEPFLGEVLKVEPQSLPEQAVTSFPVLITLNNENGLLRPGMNADVEILIEERLDVLAVPTAAIRTARDIETTAMLVGIDELSLREELENSRRESAADPGADDRFWVLVGKGSRFEPVYVETGVTDLDYSEVVNGLESGAEVLLLPSTGMVRTQQRTKEQISRISRIAGISRRSD